MKLAVALLLYSTTLLNDASAVQLNRYFVKQDKTRIIDTEAFLAQLMKEGSANSTNNTTQSLVQREAEPVKLAKFDSDNLSAQELAQVIQVKIKDLVNGKSNRYTLVDGADEFDKFDVRSAALAQKEKQIESTYAEELRK